MWRLCSKIYFIGNSFWKFYEVRSERGDFNSCGKWSSRVLSLMLWWSLAWFPNFFSDCPWPYCGAKDIFTKFQEVARKYIQLGPSLTSWSIGNKKDYISTKTKKGIFFPRHHWRSTRTVQPIYLWTLRCRDSKDLFLRRWSTQIPVVLAWKQRKICYF